MSEHARMGNTLPVFGRAAQPLCASLSFALLAGLGAACVKHLPPAPAPDPIVPRVEAGTPLAAGQGRLVLDVVEGPAPVQQIRMDAVPVATAGGHTAFDLHEAPGILCAVTPCVTNVPIGNVLLGFPVIGDDEATEVELVHVGPEPSVYRRSLSVYTDTSGGLRLFGILATSIGGASAITGAALLPIGLAKENGGLTTAGGITLGVGAVLLAVGIWAIRADSPTYRPGSSNHFPLGAPAP
jgi:hypothetical protein